MGILTRTVVVVFVALGAALATSATASAAIEVGLFGSDSSRPLWGEPHAVTGKPPITPQASATNGSDRVARASHAPLPNPATYPFSAHGKLLVRIGGGVATCSGTVINTPNRSMVVTAAHCIREGYGRQGRWARRAVFIPAYFRGRRPYGAFQASALWVPKGFWKNENTNFDVGLIKLHPNARGKVAEVAGSRGWMANVSRGHRYRVFGYPAGRMGGEVPRTCISRSRGIREFDRYFPGPAATRIHCDMARGSSGGGWIFGGRFLNSVISYSVPGRPEITYGPYFGRAIQQLIERHG